MTRTLLVTNDFPPKIGGIQSYLGELWDRLDPSTTSVLTAASHPGAAAYDAAAASTGCASSAPRRGTCGRPRQVRAVRSNAAVARARPDLVLFDPFIPLGLLGSRGAVPYGVVLHGAEVTFPARLPLLDRLSRRVLAGAAVVVAAGSYPEAEARRVAKDLLPPVVQVPPGVDTSRYAPLAPGARGAARARLGLPGVGPLVVSVGRLVPRKGVDVLIAAMALVADVHPDATLAVSGAGRDEPRLRRAARRARARVHFLGRLGEDDKVALLGAADAFCQPCRSRWGGLEQEGFGIVFLESAACGTPQVAGRSGGSWEAVVDAETGYVVERPEDPAAVAAALLELLGDEGRRVAMGAAARARAVASFGYDHLAGVLAEGLAHAVGGSGPSLS